MFFIVLVLYKCKLSESASFISISKSLKENRIKADVLIWDNSPKPQNLLGIDKDVWNYVKYVHCPENEGVSKAYNTGASIAVTLGNEWLILLDQDTKFNINYFEKLITLTSLNESYELIAPLIKLKNGTNFSPFRYMHKRGFEAKLTPNKSYPLSVYAIINSGMVINTKAFIVSGGYNERVKLDFADTQFIENFRKFYPEFFLLDTLVIQDFSNDEKDVNKLMKRFEMYCKSAKNCSKDNLKEHMEYFYTVFRHSVGLTLKTKNFLFLSNFFKYYLL